MCLQNSQLVKYEVKRLVLFGLSTLELFEKCHFEAKEWERLANLMMKLASRPLVWAIYKRRAIKIASFPPSPQLGARFSKEMICLYFCNNGTSKCMLYLSLCGNLCFQTEAKFQ